MGEKLIVTGIGSRKINKAAFSELSQIARRMALSGWTLRSGGAVGADSAWEYGWRGFDTKEIYKVNGTSCDIAKKSGCDVIQSYGDIWLDAEDIARNIHPGWDYLDGDSQALHTRNVFQILGIDLNTKSDVVAAYAPPLGASVRGGTATAYNLARAKGIPTFNLWTKAGQRDFFAFVLKRMGRMDERDIKPTYTVSNPLADLFEFQ